MKPFLKKHLITCLLLCYTGCLTAQKSMMAVVERLIQNHPEAEIREEFRCEPSGNEQTYTEKRRDIRINAALLTKEELERTRLAIDTEWNHVKQGKAGGVRYEMNDSINCTLIFKDSTIITPSLKNSGYMMLSMGKQLAITVQECSMKPGLPATPDFTLLREELNNIARNAGATSTQVRYTGSNGYFIFQRGEGKGWTTGIRHVVQKADETHFLRLWNLFDRYMKGTSAVNIIRRNREVMVKNERGREFFITSFSPTGRLSFLLANVENQICIPMNWERIDYFNNGEIRPTEAAHFKHKGNDSMQDVQRKDLIRQLEMARRKLAQTERKIGDFDLQELRRSLRRIKAILKDMQVSEERKQEIRRELEQIMQE